MDQEIHHYTDIVAAYANGLDVPDNIFTIVGNSKIFSNTIQNFSTNSFRRVALKCQLAGSPGHVAAMQLLPA